jgi:hypothetical protein
MTMNLSAGDIGYVLLTPIVRRSSGTSGATSRTGAISINCGALNTSRTSRSASPVRLDHTYATGDGGSNVELEHGGDRQVPSRQAGNRADVKEISGRALFQNAWRLATARPQGGEAALHRGSFIGDQVQAVTSLSHAAFSLSRQSCAPGSGRPAVRLRWAGVSHRRPQWSWHRRVSHR